MEVWVKIDTSNDAFVNYINEETARILRKTADKIENNHHISDGFEIPLKDINGNTIGFLGCYEKAKQLT